MVKNLPANLGDARDEGIIPGSRNPLEEGMATHSSILAWRIPWAEEPGGLQCVGCKESDTTESLSTQQIALTGVPHAHSEMHRVNQNGRVEYEQGVCAWALQPLGPGPVSQEGSDPGHTQLSSE